MMTMMGVTRPLWEVLVADEKQWRILVGGTPEILDPEDRGLESERTPEGGELIPHPDGQAMTPNMEEPTRR